MLPFPCVLLLVLGAPPGTIHVDPATGDLVVASDTVLRLEDASGSFTVGALLQRVQALEAAVFPAGDGDGAPAQPDAVYTVPLVVEQKETKDDFQWVAVGTWPIGSAFSFSVGFLGDGYFGGAYE